MVAGVLNLDRELFLAEYWQQKPLLIPSALSDFEAPVSADELAGLALEDEVESRIVEQHEGQWRLQHGPFTPEDFDRTIPWTLLVQAVDHYIPEVAALRHLIDFIPQWRVDDVMVSYAVDGGSVGPHYDNYDVFLLQGEGQRLWKLGQSCDSKSATLPHDSLRVLTEFDTAQEFLLNPGDILYVPPGIAHWGIAKGECTTFSIGFRAPRINDMLSRWADATLEQLDPELFYTDPTFLKDAIRPGEISRQERDQVRGILLSALNKLDAENWFGELVTEHRLPLIDERDDVSSAFESGGTLYRVAEAKLAWQEDEGGITVFSNGESLHFHLKVLDQLVKLCETWQIEDQAESQALPNTEARRLVDFLQRTGAIYAP
jgi:50S ribosomal protein L16 3-hydroxylase